MTIQSISDDILGVLFFQLLLIIEKLHAKFKSFFSE